MAESKLNLERILSIVALVVALGGSAYSALHNTASLEYLTKADFNSFQVENVKKMTQLEGKLDNGFQSVNQAISSLQFVATKDFQEFKDRTTSSAFELQKQIDFLKRDIENLQKDTAANAEKIQKLQSQLAVLEAQKASNRATGS